MNNELLSQEEINALLNKAAAEAEDDLTSEEKDIIGEIGNISMSTAATTLSSILNRKVLITTPRVSKVSFKQIVDECAVPKVVALIKFKDGLKGDNLLMMDIEDSLIIADLMMGGEGDNVQKEFTDLELSAVGEAMNQMIGSASTSMATMLGRQIDILPPNVEVWDLATKSEFEDAANQESNVCRIAFDLSVEGLIESQIMQVFAMETVDEIIKIVMNSGEEEEEVVEEVEEVEITQEPEVLAADSSPAQGRVTTVEETMKKEKVAVQKPIYQELKVDKEQTRTPRNLDLIMDVPLEFSVVLGKSKKTIKEILSFGNGSIVELNKLADEPLEIYVNGKLIAHGEVVVINENFGVRITNILSKEQRLKNF